MKSHKLTHKKLAVTVFRSSILACDKPDIGNVMIHLDIFDSAIVSDFCIVPLSLSSDHYVTAFLALLQLLYNFLCKELRIDDFRPECINISQSFFLPYLFTFVQMSIELTVILNITSQMTCVGIDL